VRKHLEAHAWGSATAADFLAAISREAGKDVAAPFATFLDQAGAPRVVLELVCKKGEQPKLELSQRLQLPLGSKGSANQNWQVPLCVRFAVGGKETHACTLLTKPIDTMPLEAKSCPDWVMPNDGMKGYSQWPSGWAFSTTWVQVWTRATSTSPPRWPPFRSRSKRTTGTW
jgi:cytosol alanyl aminopeptidase